MSRVVSHILAWHACIDTKLTLLSVQVLRQSLL